MLMYYIPIVVSRTKATATWFTKGESHYLLYYNGSC